MSRMRKLLLAGPIIADPLAEPADTSAESSVDVIARLLVPEAERYKGEDRLVGVRWRYSD